MTGVAVTNSTCIIALQRINRLELLRSSFRQIVMPTEVHDELGVNFEWIGVRAVTDRTLLAALNVQVDRGEAAAIALALETEGASIVLDDRKARRPAKELGLPLLGTIALVLRAKRTGIIANVGPLLDELTAAGFHLADRLKREALRIAGEVD